MRIILLLVTILVFQLRAKAQFEIIKDSVVQLYGVVMTADSLKGLNGAFVKIVGQNRGTASNQSGVFSIAALKGDEVEFNHLGFKAKTVKIPSNIEGNEYSVICLLSADTVNLPTIIIKKRPSREEFDRDFVSMKVDDDAIETARKNTNAATREILSRVYSTDAGESYSRNVQNIAARNYYNGQMPPMRILSVSGWTDFIKAWKRGDFKKKKKK
jgi:hypothetical protein